MFFQTINFKVLEIKMGEAVQVGCESVSVLTGQYICTNIVFSPWSGSPFLLRMSYVVNLSRSLILFVDFP